MGSGGVVYGRRLRTPVCVLWGRTPGDVAILLLRTHRAIVVALLAVVLVVLFDDIRHVVVAKGAVIKVFVGSRAVHVVHLSLHAFVTDSIAW